MARFKQLMARLENDLFMVEPNYGQKLLDSVNGELHHTEVAQRDTVTYQKLSNIAVIALDGAMYKKSQKGICESVVGYDTLIEYARKAEEDDSVEYIVVRFDTPGGGVAGIDEAHSVFKNSKKKTIAFLDNQATSGGVYLSSAFDEIYANEPTIIGSIGVIALATAKKKDTGEEQYIFVSENAPNKNCELGEKSCMDRITKRINTQESIFYDRLIEKFGKTKEEIKQDFDSGSVIFAKEAEKLGYLDGVLHFDELLAKLSPSGQTSSVNSAEGMGQNSTKGQQMENPKAVTPDEEQSARIEALQAEIVALQEENAAMFSMTAIKERLAIAGKYDADMQTLAEMFGVSDDKEATIIALEAKNTRLELAPSVSEGATTEPAAKTEDEEPSSHVSDEEASQIVEDI